MPRQQKKAGVFTCSFTLDVWHLACHNAYMNKQQAQSALTDINITEFAKRSKVPLRTLWRLKKGEGEPTKGTLALLAADLKRINPPKVKKGEEK